MSFYFQDDFYEAAELMSTKDRRVFFDAIVTFFFTGSEIQDMPTTVKLAFIGFRERIAMARKQSENAKKPRKPNASQSKAKKESNTSQTLAKTQPELSQTLAKTEPNESQNLDPSGESESESEIKETPKGVKKSSRFSPPTVDDIKSYCEQSGHSVDAQRFFDFYESKGWMVGRNKMKDWRAAVRNWARRDDNQGGANLERYSKYAD